MLKERASSLLKVLLAFQTSNPLRSVQIKHSLHRAAADSITTVLAGTLDVSLFSYIAQRVTDSICLSLLRSCFFCLFVNKVFLFFYYF